MVLYNKLLNYQLSVINAVLQYHRHKHQNLLIHKPSNVNSDLHDLVLSAANEERIPKINSQHPSNNNSNKKTINAMIPKEQKKNKLSKPASHQHH
jgi:hypothetical protein